MVFFLSHTLVQLTNLREELWMSRRVPEQVIVEEKRYRVDVHSGGDPPVSRV